MNKILHFVLVFCITLSSFSQNSNFKGTVVEEDNNTRMVNAIVTIQRTALAQTTNENGEFFFNQSVPSGEHTVTITKAGYEDNSFLINVYEGKNMIVDRIEIAMTKQERKRRKKIIKEEEKRDKELAKEEKKLKKNDKKVLGIFNKKSTDVKVIYEDAPVEEEEEEETVSQIQTKYANMLGLTPGEITNVALYEFIDEWIGTTYLWGGSSKEGIDCSYFALKLFNEVYDELIERIAQTQYDSNKTVKWDGRNHLKEGDLLFFRQAGDLSDNIVHVGVYLANNKFVNATEFTGGDGNSGVRIDDLSVRYWQDRLFAAGRRKIH